MQMAQTAVCNRHHSADKRLCRWLRLSLDCLDDNELLMTQELIADMLGLRREGVTEASGDLQTLGIMEYTRGKTMVLVWAEPERLCRFTSTAHTLAEGPVTISRVDDGSAHRARLVLVTRAA
jgi:hypothetical protein